MRSVQIYQTGHRDFRFMEYDYFITQAGFVDVDSFNYKKVHSTQLNLSSNDMVACEQLFTLFNTNIPENYKARSLSVSDIIVLDGKEYFVDSVGFIYLDPNKTAYKVFKKCFYNLKQNSYFDEVVELFSETTIDMAELCLENASALTEVEFRSTYGITLKFGVKEQNGNYKNIVTLFAYEMSEKAFQLIGEFCAAFSYQITMYIESINVISEVA